MPVRVPTACVLLLLASACSTKDGWTVLPTNPAAAYTLRAQCCESVNAILMQPDGRLWSAGYGGMIRTSTDLGRSWEDRPTGVWQTLRALGNDSNGVLWAVGGMGGQNGGILLKSLPSGEWQTVSLPIDVCLNAIAFSGSSIYLGGDNGYFLQSSDRGQTWAHVKLPGEASIEWVYASPDGRELAAGGSNFYLTSVNGGATWTSRLLGIQQRQRSLFVAADPKQRWIVGDKGIILHSADRGATWHPQQTPLQYNLDLFTVFGTPDGKHVIAAGGNGTILETRDGGDTWNSVEQPVTEDLIGGVMTAEGSAWLVGANGTVLTTKDGTSWIDLGHGDTPANYAVRGLPHGDAVLVAGPQGVAKWQKGRPPARIRVAGAQSVKSVGSTEDRSFIWLVGERRFAAVSSDGGEHWTRVTFSDSLHLSEDTDFGTVFVEEGKRTIWITANAGIILVSRDGGRSWTRIDSASDSTLDGIFVTADHQHVWVGGDEGMVLYSPDAGSHWEKIETGFQDDLGEITGSQDGNLLWIAGDRGRILKGTNRGHTWRVIPTPTRQNLLPVWMSADGRQIWAAGQKGAMVHSSNGGDNWQLATIATKENLYDFDIGVDGILRVVGEGGVAFHLDDGSWVSDSVQVSRPALWAVYLSDDGTHMWAVGNSGTLRTSSDGGESWSTATLGKGDKALYDITGDPMGRNLWIAGERGTLLYSSNRGDTWVSQSPPSPTENLDAIYRAEDGRLWAVGDQILIVSSDDGKTWRPHASQGSIRPENFNLYDITSRSGGKDLWICGTGGRVFQSTDGGLTWVTHHLSGGDAVKSLAIDADGSRVWAARSGGTIPRYLTAIDAWTIFGTAQAGAVTRVIRGVAPAELWAATDDGLRHSVDNGWNWNLSSTPVGRAMSGLALAKHSGVVVSVGAGGAIVIGKPGTSLPYPRRARVREGPFSVGLELDLGNAFPFNTESVKLYAARKSDWEQNRWELLSAKAAVTGNETKILSVDFERTRFKFSESEPVYFEVVLRAGGIDQRFSLPPLTLHPWAFLQNHAVTISIAATVVVFYACMLTLLFWAPLAVLTVYRKIKLAKAIEGLPVPLIGDLLKALSFGTLLPTLVTSNRVLDAWVRDRLKAHLLAGGGPLLIGDRVPSAAMAVVEGAAVVRRYWRYVPLPLQVNGPLGSQVLREPSRQNISAVLSAQDGVIQILGPGGSGKSTLARQIANWVLMPGDTDSQGAPALCVWIEDDTTNIATDIYKKVLNAINEELEPELLNALLSKRRLMVIIDGLSERSPAMQAHVKDLKIQLPIKSLIITARRKMSLSVESQTELYPKPLNSDTLLILMTGILEQWRQEREESAGSADSEALRVPILTQLDLGHRLAGVAMHAGAELPITPLLVSTFIEQAKSLLEQGQPLDNLPRSIPEVYFDYLARLNTMSRETEDYIESQDLIRICCQIAQVSLGETLVPSPFAGWEANTVISKLGHHPQALRRLSANGILNDLGHVGADTFYAFSSDPMAEFLAAFNWAQYCGQDRVRWRELKKHMDSSGDQCDGFRFALGLTLASYASRMRWVVDDHFPSVDALIESQATPVRDTIRPTKAL